METVHLRTDLLNERMRKQVLEAYRTQLKDQALLTYEEAAWYYGFTNQSLRHYVCEGRLKPVKKGGRRFLTHGKMRHYLRTKKVVGSPRKSQRIQLSLA